MEIRYQKIEKFGLAQITTFRKLKQYFSAHHIVVRKDQLIRQILFRPNLTGRMTRWAIELIESEFKALKAQKSLSL
jgi:hypothetical protein